MESAPSPFSTEATYIFCFPLFSSFFLKILHEENEIPIENEEPQNDVSKKGGAKPITIGQALKDTRNNSSGKHLDNI